MSLGSSICISGMGKTLLLDQIRRSLEEMSRETASDSTGNRPAFHVLYSAADIANKNVALHPWKRILREMFNIDRYEHHRCETLEDHGLNSLTLEPLLNALRALKGLSEIRAPLSPGRARCSALPTLSEVSPPSLASNAPSPLGARVSALLPDFEEFLRPLLAEFLGLHLNLIPSGREEEWGVKAFARHSHVEEDFVPAFPSPSDRLLHPQPPHPSSPRRPRGSYDADSASVTLDPRQRRQSMLVTVLGINPRPSGHTSPEDRLTEGGAVYPEGMTLHSRRSSSTATTLGPPPRGAGGPSSQGSRRGSVETIPRHHPYDPFAGSLLDAAIAEDPSQPLVQAPHFPRLSGASVAADPRSQLGLAGRVQSGALLNAVLWDMGGLQVWV